MSRSDLLVPWMLELYAMSLSYEGLKSSLDHESGESKLTTYDNHNLLLGTS